MSPAKKLFRDGMSIKKMKSSAIKGVKFILFVIAEPLVGFLEWLQVAFTFISVASGGIGLLVGAWDLLVWLLNTHWKTTHFKAPLILGICFISCLVLHGISITVLPYLKKLEQYSLTPPD
jgi:hypothetical protein